MGRLKAPHCMRSSSRTIGTWKHGMRRADIERGELFSYVSPESRMPKSHPLLRVRVQQDEALACSDPVRCGRGI